ncbi:hypothetical protein [Mycobacterium sp. ACS4331]|uniref:hypothetical protein n=1 Tax=Mycobacterium sp. ACS4331 TaxID=1834121 RepID=UPI0009EEF701|nr:hypothetical protein [Mycobacterium sp. ACS4331]
MSIDDDHDGDQVVFRSSDFSYRLHLDDGSWVLDELDDRNQWRPEVGRFSTFELAEKYLIWAWASLARSAVDAPNLGSSLYAQGFAVSVDTRQISAGRYELNSPAGSAVLPLVKAMIFSHLMDRQVEDIELEVSSGLG